jgi:hypothetical protein
VLIIKAFKCRTDKSKRPKFQVVNSLVLQVKRCANINNKG